ncbi:MAG TPA: alanine--tRNA ligase, partial [Thermoplasmata archaeon]|nr:alanine--tRNA ligase [Thermoplasmata archaeon]
MENSKTVDKQAVYALADHTKCLAFMLGDGIVPSNVKAGYLARLMIRRSIRFLGRLGIKEPLSTLIEMHINDLAKDFPHLPKARDRINEIVAIETEKYRELMARGEKLVQRFLKEKKHIDVETLIDLYDTQGIHPDMVKQIAAQSGREITVPDNFDSLVAERHSSEKKKEVEKHLPLPQLPPTRLLYYKDHYMKKCGAKVVWSDTGNGRSWIALDNTVFYPEGGGQPSDTGVLRTSGKKVEVNYVDYVEKQGDVVIHHVKGEVTEGAEIEGEINWKRMYALMKHHTGTHLINSACRMVLGDHVWQAGSQLDTHEARFDFSHYKPLSHEEMERIEKLVNSFIGKEVAVEKQVVDRNTAEKMYGIRLYQGGVPEGRTIRVIHIPGIDVEACGGMHVDNTKEVERIKILKTERIQDGVNRIVFAAGNINVARIENEEQMLWSRIQQKLENLFLIENKEVDQPSRCLRDIAALFSV